jgi:hypothetical protein
MGQVQFKGKESTRKKTDILCKQLLFGCLVDKQTMMEGVLSAADCEKRVVNLGERLELVKLDEELNKVPVYNGSDMGCILDEGEVRRCEGKMGNKVDVILRPAGELKSKFNSGAKLYPKENRWIEHCKGITMKGKICEVTSENWKSKRITADKKI